MKWELQLSTLVALIPRLSYAARSFLIVNGQIYTPGLAIVDAPQPFTPLGGTTLQVALDVSGDGRLPPYTYQALPNGTVPSSYNTSTSDNGGTATLTETFYHSITIFLSSYVNDQNFTISNGTVPPSRWNNSYVAPVLSLEPGSTVKHVNWVWPACLKKGLGEYNISIHQSFTYNSSEYYTIFDLPINLMNDLDPSRNATDCDLLNNPPISPDELQHSGDTLDFQPWVNGTGAQVDVNDPNQPSIGSVVDVPRASSYLVMAVIALMVYTS
ncbi:hypothetical protein TWF694_007180 [Orbilia ellipsospora]|uniref:Uncharacterized protein n=1 Tax=Orbilia ellipsospora TaxID=2528407 RepID=A0AAV9XH37_9PEZI